MNNTFHTAIIMYVLEAVMIFLVMMGVKRNDWLCRAPALDWVIGCLTWIPWIVTFLWSGGWGLLGCLIGQITCLYSFPPVHTFFRKYKGPTIGKTANKIVSRMNNQLGLLMTLPALPVFLIVRYSEIFLYPFLIWTMKFPTYRHGEWVNVSRQKFSGLVGADLVWCLYCDWMTGVYALGGEMLRNLNPFGVPSGFIPTKNATIVKLIFRILKNGCLPKAIWKMSPNSSKASTLRNQTAHGLGLATLFEKSNSVLCIP